MGFDPEGAQSPYRRMQDLAGRLLESLESRNDTRSRSSSQASARRSQSPKISTRTRSKRRFASLTGPQDSANDLTDALGQVADLVERSPDQDVIVYLFTDLQMRAFGRRPEEGATEGLQQQAEELFDDTARDLIERIDKIGEVVMLDVGGIAHDTAPSRANNLQITNIELRTMVAVARNPVSVMVTVKNRSDATSSTESDARGRRRAANAAHRPGRSWRRGAGGVRDHVPRYRPAHSAREPHRRWAQRRQRSVHGGAGPRPDPRFAGRGQSGVRSGFDGVRTPARGARPDARRWLVRPHGLRTNRHRHDRIPVRPRGPP